MMPSFREAVGMMADAWTPIPGLSDTLVVDGRNINQHGTSAILRAVNPDSVLSPDFWAAFPPPLNALPAVPLTLGGNGPAVAAFATAPPAQLPALIGQALAAGRVSYFPNPALQSVLAQQQALGIRKDAFPLVLHDVQRALGAVNTTVWNVSGEVTLKNIFGFRRNRVKEIKSDLLDRRLRFNLALYTVKYNDVQILTNPVVGCAGKPGVSLAAAQCVVNGGDSRASGLELEATLVPVTGVTLAGNMAYTNYYYTRVDPALRGPDGTFVPYYDPAWTANVSAQYHGPQLFSGTHIVARADANYSSSAYPASNSTLPLLTLGKLPSRWIVNARAGLAGFQAGGAEVEVSGYVKNLTNDKSIVYGVNLGADFALNYQTARMYGVDLIVSF
jgi:hypothetical protein